MKAQQTPKGVWLSTMMMSFPLMSATTYLAIMSPMAANAAIIDPNQFAYMARSCLRLLSLNISFFGGIHFGFASAAYDVANGSEELKKVQLQMFYSFVPAIAAFCSSSFLLFQAPLTVGGITYAFTSLMLTQLISLKFDHHCVKNELAPLWFKKYRSQVFALYMVLTTVLFTIYFNNYEKIQRKNDPNRIENLKSAM